MTTKTFGFTESAFLDYPDLSFTENFLHISVSRLGPKSTGSPLGQGGLFVSRIPLADVQAGSVFHIGFTHPEDGLVAEGGRLTHDAPDAAYWFGHNTNQSVRIFEWLDNSSIYSWGSLDIAPWIKDGDYSSITPGGTDWLWFNTRHVKGIRGAAFQSSLKQGSAESRRILLAWHAARGGGFSQPYIRLLPITKTTLGSFTVWAAGASSQIWNPEFAYACAHLSSNANGEVGISVAAGGGDSESTPVAGFVGDATLFVANVSSASDCRWGDYTAIWRHWPNTKLFGVSDYFINRLSSESADCKKLLEDPPPPLPPIEPVHQYRLFGRTADIGSTF